MNNDKGQIIWHKDDTAPSWQNTLLCGLARSIGVKKRWASADTVQAQVQKLKLRPASYEPKRLGRDVEVAKATTAGWPIYTLTPTNTENSNLILYLHGGGYINEMAGRHWRFIKDICVKAQARSIVPIYPVAPNGTAEKIVPVVVELLQDLMKAHGAENITVIGDSAGAGIALATAQQLHKKGMQQPKRLVLVSPWLDASVSNQKHFNLSARDPFLSVPGLAEAGRLYAGKRNVTDPLVSPLNGDCSGLAPLTIFTGDRDLLHPDSLALAQKAAQAKVPVEVYVRKDSPHTYALLPTSEGKKARALITQLVNCRP